MLETLLFKTLPWKGQGIAQEHQESKEEEEQQQFEESTSQNPDKTMNNVYQRYYRSLYQKNKKRLKVENIQHHLYTEYYVVALELIQLIRINKIANITFNKEPKIIKRHLIIKD